jgi:hypothetical protein
VSGSQLSNCNSPSDFNFQKISLQIEKNIKTPVYGNEEIFKSFGGTTTHHHHHPSSFTTNIHKQSIVLKSSKKQEIAVESDGKVPI